MSSMLEALHRFVIDSREDLGAETVLHGHFPDGEGVREGVSFLWLTPERAIPGRLHDLDPDRWTARFSAEAPESDLAPPGTTLPWMSGYWNPHHVRMIARGDWEERTFVPRDAVEFDLQGVRGVAPSEAGVPRNAEVKGSVPGGWDHEHCEICTTKIGAGGAATGYVDPEDHWICEYCFRRYAEPRTLRFMRE